AGAGGGAAVPAPAGRPRARSAQAGVVTVRVATAADLDAIRELDAQVFGSDAWGAGAWRGEWEQIPATRHIVVAVEAERVVGFAVLAVAADVADLHRVAVAPAARRRGL